MGIEWRLFSGGSVESTFVMDIRHQGPPGFMHGGASAALMDEALGLSIWYAGFQVVTVNLNITYLKPVPLGKQVHIRGAMSGRENRRIYADGKIVLPDGQVAVTAKGIYVEAPQFFDSPPESFKELKK
jgi:uncharacterized protein (TIGR00369 family)